MNIEKDLKVMEQARGKDVKTLPWGELVFTDDPNYTYEFQRLEADMALVVDNNLNPPELKVFPINQIASLSFYLKLLLNN